MSFLVLLKFQCGLCTESYYGECIRHLNVRIGEHIGISTLTKKKLSIRIAPLLIIYYFATIQHPIYSNTQEQNVFIRTERKPVNNEISRF